MKRRRRNRWLSFILAVVLVFTVTWPTVCHAVSPGESGEGSGNSEPFIRLGDLLQQQDAKPDQLHVNTILKEAFSSESTGKAWKLLDEKKVVFVSAETAAAQAIRKNLSIKVSQDDSEAAKEAIFEAEAVFDPILRFSISYSESDTYERGPKEVKVITRNWGTPPTTIPPDPNKTDPQIIEMGWIQQAGGEETTVELNASEDQENGATKTTQYTIGISQQLPWGPSMDISVVTADTPVYYDSRGNSFDASWSSSALLNLRLPLPWTKGFGRNAPQDIALKLSNKDSERSYWTVKSSINDILKQVNLSYWDIVQSFEVLNNAIENKKLIQKQHDLVSKRFEQGEATNYDKLQIEAELANAVLQEEIAKNDLLSKSYTFSELLVDEPDDTRSLLFLPAAYLKTLNETEKIDSAHTFETAMKKRPELQINRVGKEQALLSQSLAENQVRPDIRLSATFNASQNGSTYGYKDPLESWGAIGNPDSLSQTYSLLYNYPLFNRALESTLEIQKTAVKDQDLLTRTTENQIIKEISDALSQIYAAEERIASAREIVKFAEFNYNRIQSSEAAETNQYELILNLQRLNTSKLTLVSALVDLKKATTTLQAAQGTIAEKFVNAIYHNPMERLRLDIMAANGLLKYFRPDGKAASNSTSIQ